MEFQKNDAVLVTTDKRGVFFGYFDSLDGSSISLTKARNCIYWSRKVLGFLGLAANGPDAESRIGPAVPTLMLNGVTSISRVTDTATAAWEKEPWG